MVKRIETILCGAFAVDKNEKPELIAAVARQLKDAYRRKPKRERPTKISGVSTSITGKDGRNSAFGT